jgi:hypothetical protein
MENKQIEKLKKFRLFLLKEISELTPGQLNEIPHGLNSNIIWNLAHIVAASQMIFYKRSGSGFTIDEKLITPFLPYTQAPTSIDNTTINLIRECALSSLDHMQSDYTALCHGTYIKSENIERVYGIQILNIDDALDFLLYHEGYHAAKIIAIKQLIINK